MIFLSKIIKIASRSFQIAPTLFFLNILTSYLKCSYSNILQKPQISPSIFYFPSIFNLTAHLTTKKTNKTRSLTYFFSTRLILIAQSAAKVVKRLTTFGVVNSRKINYSRQMLDRKSKFLRVFSSIGLPNSNHPLTLLFHIVKIV